MIILKIAVGLFISMIVIHGCFIIYKGPLDFVSWILLGIESTFIVVSLFAVRKKNWARYCLGGIALLGMLFITLAPLSAHAIERTVSFYLLFVLSFAVLSFVLYTLFIDKSVKEHF